MDDTWEVHTKNLELSGTRLVYLNAHDALAILKNSLSLPKMLYHLRCTHSGDHPSLPVIDTVLHDLVCQICNVILSDLQWDQASLPVKWGDLGIRKTTYVASSAFLASVAGVVDLVSAILPAGRSVLTTSAKVQHCQCGSSSVEEPPLSTKKHGPRNAGIHRSSRV